MRFPAEVLTRDEVARLLEACGTDRWTSRRDRALLAVMYRAGTRLGETLALRACDFDLERGAIRVLHAKGGRARTVGIDRMGIDEVRGWIDEHAGLGFDPGGPLFCTASGRPISQAVMRRKLPELASKAGVHKRVHAHGFRHTQASELRAEGIDVTVIKRQLGHTSLLTTIRYLDHIEPRHVLFAVANRTTPRLSFPRTDHRILRPTAINQSDEPTNSSSE